MEPSAIIPWISPIITAVITYIKLQGAQKAGDKIAESLGEKAADAAVNTGKKALDLFRSHSSAKTDVKVQQALTNVEQDPDDEDYQQKLMKEIARLASTDSVFAQEVKALSEHAPSTQSYSVMIDNKASNLGAQGVFNMPVHFDNRGVKDHE